MVQESIANNTKIPFLESIKPDYTQFIETTKKNNDVQSDILSKQAKLRELERYLEYLQMADHVPPPCKMPILEPDTVEGEYMTTDIYNYMIHRDKQIMLFKVKQIGKFSSFLLFCIVEELKLKLITMKSTIDKVNNQISHINEEKDNVEKQKIGVQEKYVKESNLIAQNMNHQFQDLKEVEAIKSIKEHINEIKVKKVKSREHKLNEIQKNKSKSKMLEILNDKRKTQDSREKLVRQHETIMKIQSRCSVRGITVRLLSPSFLYWSILLTE